MPKRFGFPQFTMKKRLAMAMPQVYERSRRIESDTVYSNTVGI